MGSGEAIGLVGCVVTSILLGSEFVPVKTQDPGDGFVVQFMLDLGVYCVGMIVNCIMKFPTFHPLAMLGGCLWAIGNACAVPVISSVGLGVGVLLWGVTNCLAGWACSRFGLFGLNAAVPRRVGLNYGGLVLVLVGGVFFALVQSTPREKQAEMKLAKQKAKSKSEINIENDANNPTVDCNNESTNQDIEEVGKYCDTTRPSTIKKKFKAAAVWFFIGDRQAAASSGVSTPKRIFGVFLSLLSGLFYGTTFVPVLYIQAHPEQFANASTDNLTYVYAHFTGLSLTGTIIFIAYIIIKRNKPAVNNQVILPAFTGGILWGAGAALWFLSTNYVSQAISFPINTMVPGVCATIWSTVVFREVHGIRNYLLVVLGILITVAGAVMVGLSS